MLSNTCKYGIRATIYLALHAGTEKKIGIKIISKELGIPTPFLGKILQQLARQKILSSIKGPNGGFGLGRPADEISMLDIVLSIDGSDLFDMCLVDLKTCADRKQGNIPCTLHKAFSPIRKQIYEMFQNLTIDQLADELRQDNKLRI